jgi:hypothetical protein
MPKLDEPKAPSVSTFSRLQKPEMNAELGPRQIDLLPQPVLPDQLIVGEAPLQMLADHVNVLEVALHQIPFVDRGHASGIINGVDDLNRETNRVRGRETQDRAPLLSSRARRRRLGPELTGRLGQESSSGSEVGFALPNRGLNHWLIAERRLHGPRCLGARQFEERSEAGAGHS